MVRPERRIRMTIQDFMREAGGAAAAYFRENGEGKIRIENAEVVKVNDTRLHGLTMIREGEDRGWTTYIDDLYARRENGEDPADIIREAVLRCADSIRYDAPPVPDLDNLDLESIRPRLLVRLLGCSNNLSYMADRPYIDAGNGLALTAFIGCERSAASEWGISVTNGLLAGHIGCSRDELLTAALENSMEIEPPVLCSLIECVGSGFHMPFELNNYLDRPITDPELLGGAFMLTNRSSVQGAAVLFYPGVMEKISEALGGGYYVLPSSVHELILVPDSMEPDTIQLIEMVREANATVVEHMDLLSDNVLHYDPEEGCLGQVKTGNVQRNANGPS